jgi:hypothetical protein
MRHLCLVYGEETALDALIENERSRTQRVG